VWVVTAGVDAVELHADGVEEVPEPFVHGVQDGFVEQSSGEAARS
jgi:hypothetical protein